MNNLGKDFVKEMKAAFFDGMSRGWAAGVEPVKSIEFPGFDVIQVKSGGFIVTDAFFYNAIGFGFGFTAIGHKAVGLSKPLWQMQYWGVYAESVIKLLKESLLFAYRQNIFLGGRGCGHEKNNLIYKNSPRINFFEDFAGEEEIVDVTGLRYGWHEYCGGALLI